MKVSRNGALVSALAFYQCCPGSITRVSVTWGLSLLFLCFAPRYEVFLWVILKNELKCLIGSFGVIGFLYSVSNYR